MKAGVRSVKKFKTLTQTEFQKLRTQQWIAQDEMCPVLKRKIDLREASFDHKHRRKNDPIGIDGKGLLRGVLHKDVNRFEGKAAQFYKRYGLEKHISLPGLLIGLGAYLTLPPMKPEYIHPNENEKPLKLSKSEYNKIIEYWKELHPKRKPPEFPKSGKITKQFREIIDILDQEEQQKQQEQ